MNYSEVMNNVGYELKKRDEKIAELEQKINVLANWLNKVIDTDGVKAAYPDSGYDQIGYEFGKIVRKK